MNYSGNRNEVLALAELYTLPNEYTLCLKKVPTVKLSVTLSKLRPIFKICALKAYEICYKIHAMLPFSP